MAYVFGIVTGIFVSIEETDCLVNTVFPHCRERVSKHGSQTAEVF